MNPNYDATFYDSIALGSSRSAKHLVPQFLDLVKPKSVVDVGSGAGAWSAVFLENGITDLVAIDGDYVNPEQLEIPKPHFRPMDLEGSIRVDRTFDFAICLEVAEHLTPKRAESLVQDLTSLAPVIAFSAAVPGQGGTNHINEQWQSYWQDLFSLSGFEAIDCLRAKNWYNEEIEWWYRQNLILYVKKELTDRFLPFAATMPLDIVHPNNLAHQLSRFPAEPGLRDSVAKIPGLVVTAIKNRI